MVAVRTELVVEDKTLAEDRQEACGTALTSKYSVNHGPYKGTREARADA